MIRVLLADDHAALRHQLRTMLEADGHSEVCGEAADAGQAVQLALATRPDVAILDLAMGGKTGLDAAAELRARLPDLLIIVMTMYPEPGGTVAALVDAWISKTELDRLPALLRQLVQNQPSERRARGAG